MDLNIFIKPMAYLDPGTGSFVIQLVLAGLLGIGVVARIYWKKIVGIFRRNKSGDILDTLDDIDEHGDDQGESIE